MGDRSQVPAHDVCTWGPWSGGWAGRCGRPPRLESLGYGLRGQVVNGWGADKRMGRGLPEEVKGLGADVWKWRLVRTLFRPPRAG